MATPPDDPLGVARSAILAAVVEQLYATHPEWAATWGSAGKDACARDVAFSYALLEASLRANEPAILANYARWLVRLLAARGVPAQSVEESFVLLEAEVAARVPTLSKAASVHLRGAREAMRLHDETSLERAPAPPAATAFLDAVLDGDRARAERVLTQAIASGSDRAALGDDIVQPAMEEVGRRWARNEITVAQEHFATATAQSALARVAPAQTQRGQRGTRALFACVEGNLHSLGARVAADAYEAAGWTVDFLGADVPTRDLVKQLRDAPVDLVALSIALPQQLPAAQRTIAALRRELGPACPRIIIGGIPIRDYANVAEQLGADDTWRTVADSLLADRPPR